ncbi:MAG TPA: restriction endonuclease subunit S, partial [Lactobacillus johnsonii]|nr:restriction endonuclease subunit S [Lactobacillus johnsonii]
YVNKEIYDQIHNYTITADDLYFSIAGTIGKVGRVPQSLNGALLTENAAKITSYQINLNYLVQILKSPIVAQQHSRILSKVAQPKLSLIKLKQTFIPLPPLSEQSRIAAKIAQLFALLRKVESSTQQYAKLQTLLKSKVLDLAMRGKLVKQDPNDEPASVLLEKIKAEKEQLIKEKKIKKSKPLPPITDEEKPFEIPDSWKWVRLGDIGAWAAGATPSRKHPEYYGGTIPWLKTGDLNDGIVNETSEKITELGVKNSSVKVNEPGNVLIAMYGATIGKLGIVGNQELVTNQACCGCSLFDGVHNWYLFYYLLASRKRLIDLGSGGAQPNISKNKIEKFTFPLPPLEEQNRIVTKVERLFALLGKSAKSPL